MYSRTHVAQWYNPHRFSTTRTLSDFPLLIGEILRRGELRAQRQARRRSLIQKFLSAPLGSLPPLKIHCAQLVEEALRSALAPDAHAPEQKNGAPTLLQRLQAPAQESKKIVLRPSNE